MRNRLHITVHAYIFWPIAYLATLAVSISVLWWVILIGGRPFEFREIVSVDATGEVATTFRPGATVGVRRLICTSSQIEVHTFPVLLSDRGLSFDLPSGVTSAPYGCSSSIYAFVMPTLPPGSYTLRSTIRFQNNLVGRDEYSLAPAINIEVTP